MVKVNGRGEDMLRSTWLSAAKFTAASKRKSSNSLPVSCSSQISPRTNVNRPSPNRSATEDMLPAYVSLSRQTISVSACAPSM